MNNRSSLFEKFQISILTSHANKFQLIKTQFKIDFSLLHL